MFTNGEVNARGGRWSVEARGTPAGGQPEAIDLLLNFRLAELSQLDGLCDDLGRLAAIRRCVAVTLATLNTVSYTLGEPVE